MNNLTKYTESKRVTILVNANPLGNLIYDTRNCDENIGFSVPKNMTASEYLREIANMLDTPSKKITGECKSCFALLIEGETHECKK